MIFRAYQNRLLHGGFWRFVCSCDVLPDGFCKPKVGGSNPSPGIQMREMVVKAG